MNIHVTLWFFKFISTKPLNMRDYDFEKSTALMHSTWAASWENRIFACAKTKAQISFAVTAKLISAFVFATRIVYFLFYLNPKFQASSSFLRLYRFVSDLVGNPEDRFSRVAAQ